MQCYISPVHILLAFQRLSYPHIVFCSVKSRSNTICRSLPSAPPCAPICLNPKSPRAALITLSTSSWSVAHVLKVIFMFCAASVFIFIISRLSAFVFRTAIIAKQPVSFLSKSCFYSAQIGHLSLHLPIPQVSSPVFFRRDEDEFFYVRSGPSSRHLTPSELLAYLDARNNV